MAKKMEVTQERLKELFEYLPETGQLRRLVTRSHLAKAGVIVGTVDGKGYLHVNLDKRFYRIHRLVWLYVHGEQPDQLDHIDGDRKNNRVENLRPCTCQTNAGNAGLANHNTSGFRGVSMNAKSGKWAAQIKIFGEQTYLGRYDTPEEAARVYDAAAIEHFGEFARLNNV